jgi:hypothetical protein
MKKFQPKLQEIEFNKLIFSEEFNMRETLSPQRIDSFTGQAKSKIKPQDYEDIESLMKSIDDFGLLQNIVVRETKDGLYEIIAGYRRYMALRKKRYNGTIPALVFPKDTPSSVALGIVLTENMQRRDVKRDYFAKFVVRYAVAYLNDNKYAGTGYSIKEEDVIKALWLVHDRMFPGVAKKPVIIPAELQDFINDVEIVVMKLLDELGVNYSSFISDIFPVIANRELQEELEKGSITVYDIRFLGKVLKERERERIVAEKKSKPKTVENTEDSKPQVKSLNRSNLQDIAQDLVNEESVEPVQSVESDGTESVEHTSIEEVASVIQEEQDHNIPDSEVKEEEHVESISDALDSVLAEQHSEENLEVLREEFRRKFTKFDYDTSEVVRQEAEGLGLSRDDLQDGGIKEILAKKSTEEERVNLLESFLEETSSNLDELSKEISKDKELQLFEDLDTFHKMSAEKKAIVADNFVENVTDFSKDKYAAELEEILNVAKAEALTALVEEISDILSVTKRGEVKDLINSYGEIGVINQGGFWALAKYFKKLGEELEKRYKLVPDDKKGTLLDVAEAIWIRINFKMNREVKNEVL